MFTWHLLFTGDLSNGTSVTHLVNKMEVVNYLTKVYGYKNDDRSSDSVKGISFIIVFGILIHFIRNDTLVYQ